MKILLIALLLLLSACADSRLIKPEADSETPTLGLKAQNADGVKVTLRQIVVRDAPGSWVRNAAWDEYIVVLENNGSEFVSLQSIALSSDLLAETTHTTARTGLESASEQNMEALRRMGAGAMVGAAVATTAMTAAFMSAGWTLATPAAPIAILAGGVYAWSDLRRRSKDGAIIDHQLDRRGVRLPATLAPGSELAGSAFFPITPEPRQLRLRYLIDGNERELTLELKLPELG